MKIYLQFCRSAAHFRTFFMPKERANLRKKIQTTIHFLQKYHIPHPFTIDFQAKPPTTTNPRNMHIFLKSAQPSKPPPPPKPPNSHPKTTKSQKNHPKSRDTVCRILSVVRPKTYTLSTMSNLTT